MNTFIGLLLGSGIILALSRGYILRNINKDGAFSAACRNSEGIAQNIGKLFNISYHVVMLGNRHRDALNINLLERVAADHGSAHIAGDGNHRHGIHISRCNTCYKIR